MLNECNGCEYKCSLSHIDICTLGSPCPHQRSTPMTNEEWFCELPTEEKAEWLENKMTWAAQEQGTFTAKGWEMWLKQPHTVKE